MIYTVYWIFLVYLQCHAQPFVMHSYGANRPILSEEVVLAIQDQHKCIREYCCFISNKNRLFLSIGISGNEQIQWPSIIHAGAIVKRSRHSFFNRSTYTNPLTLYIFTNTNFISWYRFTAVQVSSIVAILNSTFPNPYQVNVVSNRLKFYYFRINHQGIIP